MPGIAAHFAVASEIERLLQFREDSFYYGCILPDIISSQKPAKPRPPRRGHRPGRKPVHARQIYVPDPHYHQPGTYCLVPDLDQFWRETELHGFLKFGYAAHLLLDRLFLEEFGPQCIPGFDGRELFVQDKIYRDYSRLNPLLVLNFRLSLSRINHILEQEFFYIPIDEKMLQRNYTWINNLDQQPPPQYINTEEMIEFLKATAISIIADPHIQTLTRELSCDLPFDV